MKTENDAAEAMSDGSSFQRLAPETGKAHLSTMVRQKVGTVKRRPESLPSAYISDAGDEVSYDDG